MEAKQSTAARSVTANGASLYSTIVAVAVTGIAIAAAPRLGPLRALHLGLSTRWRTLATTSVRQAHVNSIKDMLAVLRDDQYLVVYGPKGVGTCPQCAFKRVCCLHGPTVTPLCYIRVGKSTALATALAKQAGVSIVEVQPGSDFNTIMPSALRSITGQVNVGFDLQQSTGAARVSYWHKLFWNVPPTIVLHAVEGNTVQRAADMHNAATVLAGVYNLRVVIDASYNLLPMEALQTGRSLDVHMDPMSFDEIHAIPELTPVHAALRASNLDGVMWSVFGGNVAAYQTLHGRLTTMQYHNPEVVEWEVKQACMRALLVARHNCTQALRTSKTRNALKKLYSQFIELDAVPFENAAAAAIDRGNRDHVLQTVWTVDSATGGMMRYVQPVNPATRLMLRYKRRSLTCTCKGM
jgi:hypothetical protein